MNKSFFHFTVAKFINIFYNEIRELTQIKDNENKLIKTVFKLLYFFVEGNPDNCLIALTTGILGHLSALSAPNSDKFLTFMCYCIQTLALHKNELSTTKKWLKCGHQAFSKSIVLYL